MPYLPCFPLEMEALICVVLLPALYNSSSQLLTVAYNDGNQSVIDERIGEEYMGHWKK